jgi:hypothetical protein
MWMPIPTIYPLIYLQGNVMAGSDGVAHIDMTDAQITLVGPNTVVGRSMVVHEKEDDLGLFVVAVFQQFSYFYHFL